MTTVRVGTRGSALARIQTGHVCDALGDLGLHVEVVVIETEGDRDQKSAFPEIGSAGIFVREIERALVDGRIDVAVHSYKDLPSVQPAELTIAAIPKRLDPADHLLVRSDRLDRSAGRLPVGEGARIGTSSARRTALLLHERGELEVLPLRGNVDTRVGKLASGDYDAIVLAGAGLQRMRQGGGLPELAEMDIEDIRLAPEWFIPAPAQGALAIQSRLADDEITDAVGRLQDRDSALPLLGERRLLARVEGNCELPFGAWCRRRPTGDFAISFALGPPERLLVSELYGDEPRLLADRAWELLDDAGLVPR